MTNRKLVRSIYRTAYCEQFYMGYKFPNERYIVRYWPSGYRAESIGWGSTIKKAWEDAANTIKSEMLKRLES